MVLGLAACHNYVPVETPGPGDYVRARLTVEAALRRDAESDQPRRVLEGRVVRHSPESLELDVSIGRAVSEFDRADFHRVVTLSAAEVEGLSRRELSGWRTGVATAGIVAAAWVFLDQVVEVGGGGDDDGDGGDPASVVPLFRIPVGR